MDLLPYWVIKRSVSSSGKVMDICIHNVSHPNSQWVRDEVKNGNYEAVVHECCKDECCSVNKLFCPNVYDFLNAKILLESGELSDLEVSICKRVVSSYYNNLYLPGPIYYSFNGICLDNNSDRIIWDSIVR